MLPSLSFLSSSTSETCTGNKGQPKQCLVGADCHVPKVTSRPNSKSHIFLGGMASHHTGEPLYSVDQNCAMQTQNFVQPSSTAFWFSVTSSQLLSPNVPLISFSLHYCG
ncbi:hypothetical protein CRENBAI_010399 [Crenichthys baileyi]|uniref:Uncharacterized protein n=1 Tax=Crenichthys baileyi TaxID=28760 RepID=A0AAV9QSY2_9TELE